MPILVPKPLLKPRVETDLKALADAANEAARREAAQWFYFVTIMITIAALVGSTTHRVLFLEEAVRVPFLGVELPLLGFYVVVPAIFVVLHLYTLAQLRLMARKLRAFLDELDRQTEEDTAARERALQRLDNFSVLQLLVSERYGTRLAQVRVMAWTTLVAAPVVLLLFVQLRFLPYQSEWITWWHRGLILLDLSLVWWLWPSFAGAPTPRFWYRPVLRWGAAAVAAAFSLLLATIPDEATELRGLVQPVRAWLFDGPVDATSQRPTSPFARRLVLPDEDFVPEDDARLATMARTRVLRGRDLRLATLDRVDLRKADLTGADLRGASLVRARLAGAVLDGARLDGAELANADFSGASFTCLFPRDAAARCARLTGAVLNGAILDGAKLEGAELPRVMLDLARMRGASLKSANLQGASMMRLEAQGADFTHARMQAASLTQARFEGAIFDHAVMDGVSFWEAQGAMTSMVQARLHGASFGLAQFPYARLDGAQLYGAGFGSTNLQGASLRGVRLWRASVNGATFRDAALNDVVDAPGTAIGLDGRGTTWTAWRATVVRSVDAWRDPELLDRQLGILEEPPDPGLDQRMRATWPTLPSPDPARVADGMATLACSHAHGAWLLRSLLHQMEAWPDAVPSRRTLITRIGDLNRCPAVRGLREEESTRLRALTAE